eukprot:164290-Prorocentrum_minimum.AAC.1
MQSLPLRGPGAHERQKTKPCLFLLIDARPRSCLTCVDLSIRCPSIGHPQGIFSSAPELLSSTSALDTARPQGGDSSRVTGGDSKGGAAKEAKQEAVHSIRVALRQLVRENKGHDSTLSPY